MNKLFSDYMNSGPWTNILDDLWQTETDTAHRVISVPDKAQRWRIGYNFFAPGGSSSEVEKSTALNDFNLPRRRWSTERLASARFNLQYNPQPNCFASTVMCTFRLSNRKKTPKKQGWSKRRGLPHLVPSWALLWDFSRAQNLNGKRRYSPVFWERRWRKTFIQLQKPSSSHHENSVDVHPMPMLSQLT